MGANNLCAGTTTTLVDTTAGGIWTSSNTALATVTSVGTGLGLVSAIAGGTLNITYSVTNLCGTAVVTKSLTVNPLADAGTISGPPEVCIGSSVTVTESIPGGRWSSTNSNVSVSSASGIVTGMTVGMDTIIYTKTNSCGSKDTSFAIRVDPLPVAGTISGPDNLCQGTQISLAATASGGSWTTSNTNVSVLPSGVVSGDNPGESVIFYTVSNYCGTISTSHTVTVDPLPVSGDISGAINVCIGSSITLTGVAAGGSWKGNIPIASVAGGIINGYTAGIIIVSYSVTNNCGIAVSTHTISVNPIPDAGKISGIDSVCPGDTVEFVNTVSGGDWSNHNSFIATVLSSATGSGIVIGKLPGKDTAIYTVNTLGCIAHATFPYHVRTVEACTKVVPPDTTKGFNCSGTGEINIYPNPSQSGQFTIGVFSTFNEEVNIVITNAVGQKVFHGASSTNVPTVISLDVAPGVYTVLAVTPHGKCKQKLTIIR